MNRSVLVGTVSNFPATTSHESRYRPAQLRTKRGRTVKKLWLVAVACLALSTGAVDRSVTEGFRRLRLQRANPVASWVDSNAGVCIKYVCEGGGFQIRCLPAPPLEGLAPEGSGSGAINST
jgi:hypothetical protein